MSFSPVVKAAAFAAVTSFIVLWASTGQDFNVGSIFSGVFDFTSIFTGFLATFYVFVVTKGNDFLKEIQGTKTFVMVLRLLKYTILWSVVVIVLSYGLMIWEPRDYEPFSWPHGVVFFWLLNVFVVAVNFTRCSLQFLQIAEAEDG